jgi:hypothetical protein
MRIKGQDIDTDMSFHAAIIATGASRGCCLPPAADTGRTYDEQIIPGSCRRRPCSGGPDRPGAASEVGEGRRL